MVSIAIPASCVSSGSCNSIQQATYTLYQISRACVLFDVEEIIVYDIPEAEEPPAGNKLVAEGPKKIKLTEENEEEEGPTRSNTKSSSNMRNPELVFSANMLQYLITPSHLRKLLFKPLGKSNQFRYAKMLPKIPGLLDSKKVIQGVAVPRKHKKKAPGQKKLSKKDRKESGQTAYINVGFDKLFKLRNDALVPTNSRVIVDLAKGEVIQKETLEKLKEKGSIGYSVRAVTQFSQIFTQSTVPDGYSQSIYIPSQQFKSHKATSPLVQQVALNSIQKDKLLLVFGKWSEIQTAVARDPELPLEDASEIFDGIVLGTERTRLEDSVTVALARA